MLFGGSCIRFCQLTSLLLTSLTSWRGHHLWCPLLWVPSLELGHLCVTGRSPDCRHTNGVTDDGFLFCCFTQLFHTTVSPNCFTSLFYFTPCFVSPPLFYFYNPYTLTHLCFIFIILIL